MKTELPARLVIEAIRGMILDNDLRGGIVRLLQFLEVDNTTLEAFKYYDYGRARPSLLAKLEVLKHN